MSPRSCSASRPPISLRRPRRSLFWRWWLRAPGSCRRGAPAPSIRFRHYDMNKRRDAMKWVLVVALLLAVPALADWRWEGREDVRAAMAEARRARAEARRELAEARRDMRREMGPAHREGHHEFRHAQVDWAREMRQAGEELRQEMRQVREDLRQAFR